MSGLAPLFVKAALMGFTKKGGELPDRSYELHRVRVDPEHLADYARVCCFRLSDELPATYPHVLGFPLQVKLMTDRDFPFPLIGSVHIANRITQHRPVRVDEPLDLRVRVANLRAHPRGSQFDVITEVFVRGEAVWNDTSTYLRRSPGGGSSGPSGETPPEPTATWHVPGDTGRRYAEVSGDRNPIHLHRLTARLFGFRRAIAHGMWTKARCLAAFEGRLAHTFTVDVRFKLPLFLPNRVGFHTDGTEFTVHGLRGGKPHLTGTITAAGAPDHA
ncbi:MaoC/PaaZ C-terminal domain-containing protein [Actinokineospora auranticolor]|uniref:MaoC dehydratase-like protein n=1 Tax=Actinokineospora auranticolor TaxID=155976 RepID=A0A2S6GS14_9PSEU|nr:MaoC/PaaZ C-terminal domain-containing protein [Actinokineospora auranticolor]PPK67989.1 MaoC dehydratase-like protein [Actinokineospora auranticolor]